MTERDFIYWLQGFLELSDARNLNETQTQMIRDHMKLVLKKVTPDIFMPCESDYPQPAVPRYIPPNVICSSDMKFYGENTC